MSEQCRFFIPGPSWVRPEILAEMSRPLVGHRSADFREIATRVLGGTRELFRTKQHAFVATCSGTGILEAALVNCVPRSVLVLTCGAFSERWKKIADQLGLEVDHIDQHWGEAIDPVRLENHLKGRHHHYDAVTITHNETSTGVINDVKLLSDIVHQASADTLVLVDAVSSLACAPLLVDEWGIDVCVASCQKGVAIPPGLTLFSVSERAMERAAKTHYRGMYFDFMEYRRQAETSSIPFTPSISHYFALDRQLDHILREEGLEKRWERHQRMREITLDRIAAVADPMCPRDIASPSVSALRPRNASPREVLDRMKARGFTLGGGYGQWRDQTIRIGHMGDVDIDSLQAMLDVLVEVAA